MCLGGDIARVEVQAGNGVGALGLGGLLLDGDGPPLAVELHDAEALGVVHVVAEDRGPARLGVLDGARQVARQAVAVEDVVAEHQCARLAGDEVLADREGLGQAVRARAARRRKGSRRSVSRPRAGARSWAGRSAWR